ncbi:hypothetical protein EAD89_26675 [Micromonospora sp. BL4]|nr:hypothetical protein EAD89_26675 [Micromonospora sp. BL4]
MHLGVANIFAAPRLLTTTSDRTKDIEILALRHQIMVLQRHLGEQRLRFDPGDRRCCPRRHRATWCGGWAAGPSGHDPSVHGRFRPAPPCSRPKRPDRRFLAGRQLPEQLPINRRADSSAGGSCPFCPKSPAVKRSSSDHNDADAVRLPGGSQRRQPRSARKTTRVKGSGSASHATTSSHNNRLRVSASH